MNAGEECDDGTAKNGSSGDGCSAACKWVCIAGDPTRGDPACNTSGNACAGTATCAANHTCTPGTPLDAGASCGNGMVCNSGICGNAVCGDGIVSGSEACDDGAKNGTSGDGCNSNCQWVCTSSADCMTGNACAGTGTCTVATHLCSGSPPPDGTACGDGGSQVCKAGQCVAGGCGDGVRESGEQCDDGNMVNLDGCNSACQFEQDHRATTVSIDSNATSPCGANSNALGSKALTALALGQLNPSLQSGVDDGTTTIAFEFLGLTDLTGQSQASGLTLGSLTGAAAQSSQPADSGVYDSVDWWYTTSATSIDAKRNPTSTLPGTFAGGVLNATGSVTLTVSLAGALAVLDMSNTKLTATVGTASKPKISTGGSPGHLAAENIDPALTTFETMTGGKLCGNASAKSLSTVPVPTILTTQFKCNEGYAVGTNSLLDVIVGGCTVVVLGVITPTQPDQVSAATPAGAGGPYTLVQTGNKVTGCKDKSGTAVANLDDCLSAAAYSAYFDFTSDRVIMK